MTGIVPDSGKVTLAVSGYDDYAFNGNHYEFGDYMLTIDAARIPEPSTITIWSLFGMPVFFPSSLC